MADHTCKKPKTSGEKSTLRKAAEKYVARAEKEVKAALKESGFKLNGMLEENVFDWLFHMDPHTKFPTRGCYAMICKKLKTDRKYSAPNIIAACKAAANPRAEEPVKQVAAFLLNDTFITDRPLRIDYPLMCLAVYEVAEVMREKLVQKSSTLEDSTNEERSERGRLLGDLVSSFEREVTDGRLSEISYEMDCLDDGKWLSIYGGWGAALTDTLGDDFEHACRESEGTVNDLDDNESDDEI